MTCVASFPLVLFSLGPAPAPEPCGFASRGRGTMPCIYKTHLPWRVDGFIPKPFSSRDPRRLELCAYPPPQPPFSTLFLNTLKIVLVSFAAWTSSCMKCNKSHFRLFGVWVSVSEDIHGTLFLGLPACLPALLPGLCVAHWPDSACVLG